jgi:hypothetical protein
LLTNQLLKAVDIARLGSIINVYARKSGQAPAAGRAD